MKFFIKTYFCFIFSFLQASYVDLVKVESTIKVVDLVVAPGLGNESVSHSYLVPQEIFLALNKIQHHLEMQNVGLKIFNFKVSSCIPPYRTQSWNEPYEVNVTLIDLKNNLNMPMPSRIGDSRRNDDLSLNQRKNCELLKEVMIKYGFRNLKNWWSFEFAHHK